LGRDLGIGALSIRELVRSLGHIMASQHPIARHSKLVERRALLREQGEGVTLKAEQALGRTQTGHGFRSPPLLLRGGLITGLGCGESTGSSVVKRLGSPSGAGTHTRFGRFGSGNFGPPGWGAFTMSRFVYRSSLQALVTSLATRSTPPSHAFAGRRERP
jgi:hypothetical protein